MTENLKRRAEEMEKRQEMDVREDASRYLKARLILNDLRDKMRSGKISWQQYSTLRGQALAGDVDGAVKGLARVLRKRWEGNGQ
jgi:hypothetical protein